VSDGTTYLYLSWDAVIQRRAMIPVPGSVDLSSVLALAVDRCYRGTPLPFPDAQLKAGELSTQNLRLHSPDLNPRVWLETNPTRGWVTATSIPAPAGRGCTRDLALVYLGVAGYVQPTECEVTDSHACGAKAGWHRCDEIDGHRYGRHVCACGHCWE